MKRARLTKSDLNIFYQNCLKPFKNQQSRNLNRQRSPSVNSSKLPEKNFQSEFQLKKEKEFVKTKAIIWQNYFQNKNPDFRKQIKSVAQLPRIAEKEAFAARVSKNASPLIHIQKSGFEKAISKIHLENKPNQQGFQKVNFKTQKKSSPNLQEYLKRKLSSSGNSKMGFENGKVKTIQKQLSPINIFNIKNLSIVTKNGKVNFGRQKSIENNVQSNILRKREFQNEFKGNLDGDKNTKNSVNFETYVKKKQPFRELKKSKKKTIRRNSVKDEKFGNLEKLISNIMNLKKRKVEIGVQKTKKRFFEINFSNTNICDLLKDISKAEIVEQKQLHKIKAFKNQKEKNEDIFKKMLLQENLKLIKEQIFFEGFLQVLNENDINIERLFQICNKRLKIKSQNLSKEEMDKKNLKSISSISDSEISILNLNLLDKKIEGFFREHVGALEFDKVGNYSSSSSDKERETG